MRFVSEPSSKYELEWNPNTPNTITIIEYTIQNPNMIKRIDTFLLASVEV